MNKFDFNNIKKFIITNKMTILILAAFVLIFIADLFALRYLSMTGFVTSCLALVLNIGLAVCLSKSSYGILGAVALAELLVGLISGKFLFTVLAVIIYFATLVAIYFLHKYEGAKK